MCVCKTPVPVGIIKNKQKQSKTVCQSELKLQYPNVIGKELLLNLRHCLNLFIDVHVYAGEHKFPSCPSLAPSDVINRFLSILYILLKMQAFAVHSCLWFQGLRENKSLKQSQISVHIVDSIQRKQFKRSKIAAI